VTEMLDKIDGDPKNNATACINITVSILSESGNFPKNNLCAKNPAT